MSDVQSNESKIVKEKAAGMCHIKNSPCCDELVMHLIAIALLIFEINL